MKWKLKKNKNSKNFTVDIPPTVDLNHLTRGDFFSVKVSEEFGEILDISICLIADKRSYLVGNKIVRVEKIKAHKKNKYRIPIKIDGILTHNFFLIEPIRAVLPKELNLNANNGEVRSPMTGKIISILVSEKQKVETGETLLVIEAMKMENRIFSEFSGVVNKIYVNNGNNVNSDELLIQIIPDNS